MTRIFDFSSLDGLEAPGGFDALDAPEGLAAGSERAGSGLEDGLSGDYIGDSGRSERDASDTSCEPHDSAAASRRRTAASFPTTESNSFTGSDTVPPVNAIRIG